MGPISASKKAKVAKSGLLGENNKLNFEPARDTPSYMPTVVNDTSQKLGASVWSWIQP